MAPMEKAPSLDEVKEWLAEIGLDVEDLAQEAVVWEIVGFDPMVILKILMSKEANSVVRTTDITVCISVVLSFGNIHAGNVVRRMQKPAKDLLAGVRTKYGIVLRKAKGSAIALEANTLTLPRILACFPYIAGVLLFKEKVVAPDPSAFFPGVDKLPNVMKFTGFTSLLFVPEETNKDKKTLILGVIAIIRWASIGFGVGFDRMINPAVRKEDPREQVRKYEEISYSYKLGSAPKNLELLIASGVIRSDWSYAKAIQDVAVETARLFDAKIDLVGKTF